MSSKVPAVTAVAALTVGLLTACTATSPSAQERTAERFLSAIAGGDVAGAARQTDRPEAARAAVAASIEGLGLGAGAEAEFDVGKVRTDGGTARAAFSATWRFGRTATWHYDGELRLARTGDRWRVAWRDSALHPSLEPGTHLSARRELPARAALRDAEGRPLFVPTPVVRVGLEKRRVEDADGLAAAVADVPELQTTAQEVLRLLRGGGPTEFLPIITLRRPVYERIRSRIHDLPGTVFRTGTLLLTPAPHFGQPLLGQVGPATAEIVDESAGRIRPGDETGLGGLQQALDRELAGAAGLRIVVADANDTPVRSLAAITRPRPGRDVRLTLRRKVQSAADAALADVRQQAALVAVRPSTGDILAVGNTENARYDLALAGAFPPGSTFKIATWLAAFMTDPDLTPSTTVSCPPTTTVDGRLFQNADRFSHPPVPVAAAFGYSCNTSAIIRALAMPNGALRDTARELGLGARWKLPVEAFSGSLPNPRSETEEAADAIGQGRVQVSPLLMALMAGAAATGERPAPRLLASADPAAEHPLDPGMVRAMRPLLRATVELAGGTAHELADIGRVTGKTGTAEYGEDRPPRSHSWFAGTRGDLAFAVFVYDGASAGVDAVPIVERFLRAVG